MSSKPYEHMPGTEGAPKDKEPKKIDFDTARTYVIEKWPDLAERIDRSLRTPQLGAYHNEGQTMESHLRIILETLGAVKAGNFHADLAEDHELQDVLRSTVRHESQEHQGEYTVNPIFVEYTFLHDIAKPYCLLLKLEGAKEGAAIGWDDWLKIEAAGKPYQWDGKTIASIAYYHPKEGGSGQHGNKAVQKILQGRGIAQKILIAIANHEIAYQFTSMSAAAYERHFVTPGFTSEEQNFILVAAYIDTMASLRRDGKPSLENFMNLARARRNYTRLKAAIDHGTQFPSRNLAGLKRENRMLTDEDIERASRE